MVPDLGPGVAEVFPQQLVQFRAIPRRQCLQNPVMFFHGGVPAVSATIGEVADAVEPLGLGIDVGEHLCVVEGFG